MTLPILYSLRNCPFAMRARIAVYKSQYKVILRDIVLSNKPKEMLEASPKGTVPVLVLTCEAKNELTVIDESYDIMLWLLLQSDPNNLLHDHIDNALPEMQRLIAKFDQEFKTKLEQYKCAKRYQEDSLLARREACMPYLADLEQRLSDQDFFISSQESWADIAILPFIRQFARVERQWYLQAPYPKVRQWLNRYLQSKMFSKVMTKHPLWLDNPQAIYLGDE
ncbi:MAG: glutathione S-transferase [Psychrobium sp.]|nr:glutathione S-transferase [Psychrobium sp.]